MNLMNPLAHFFRLCHISCALFFTFFVSSRFTAKGRLPRGIRIRQTLEKLGPIFVKFGQVLSTRPDIVPEDIVKELIKLQDKVPPFPGQIAEQMITQALGQPLQSVFQQFDITPLASASVAQVHAAVLMDGRKVVVKVLRPNIQQTVQQDVALLKIVSQWAERYSKKVRQFNPKEMVLEFEKILGFELDLMREAANASQLRRHFLDSSLLYIPEVHWDLTRRNIMVMERIDGIPVYQIDVLKEQGFNLKQLAERVIEIFFTQVFRDCFFHADMHPGNIVISAEDPRSPKFIAIDFGIVGTLSSKDQRYLAENFLAFFKRDYRRVAELHIESGWLPATVRLDEFEAAIRTVCEPLFERPIKNVSIGNLLLRLFRTASQFQINIQPQLMLLQKTLLNVEGLGRGLYPELDLWQTAQPILEKWMKAQMGPSAFVRKLKASSPFWLEKLPELPNLLVKILQTAEERPTTLSSNATMRRPRVYSIIDIGLGFLFGIGLTLGFVLLRRML